MPRMSVAERRELLFAAAVRVLERDGLAALSTRAIVAEAGMSLASFHYAYETHEQLLVEIIAATIDGELSAGLAGLGDAAARTPREAIHGALTSYLELVRTDPGREQGMFELTQHALRRPTMTALAADQYAKYHAAAAELLDHVAERFEVTWSAPTADLARLVIAMTDGLTLAWLTSRDDEAAARLITLTTDALLAHLEDS